MRLFIDASCKENNIPLTKCKKKDINRPISVTLIQFISESASITLSDMLKNEFQSIQGRKM